MQLQDKAQKKFEELGQPVFLFAYFQHITDLQAKLIEDLVESLGESSFSAEVQARIALLRQVLAASSIDFTNLGSPLEAYKIPAASALKEKANVLQRQYLDVKVRDGEL